MPRHLLWLKVLLTPFQKLPQHLWRSLSFVKVIRLSTITHKWPPCCHPCQSSPAWAALHRYSIDPMTQAQTSRQRCLLASLIRCGYLYLLKVYHESMMHLFQTPWASPQTCNWVDRHRCTLLQWLVQPWCNIDIFHHLQNNPTSLSLQCSLQVCTMFGCSFGSPYIWDNWRPMI